MRGDFPKVLFLLCSCLLNEAQGMTDVCALVLMTISKVSDSLPQLILADKYDEMGKAEMAELLRLNIEIERLRHSNGVKDPGIAPLIARRTEILGKKSLLDFAVPIEVSVVGDNPFKENQDYFHSVFVPKPGKTVTLGSPLGLQNRKYGPPRRVSLFQSFEISDLITQGQWALVFGRNPSVYHKEGVFRVGEKDQVDINRPVENITYWSALVFANKLSEMEGRKPVYDLCKLQFSGATNSVELEKRAAAGSLIRESGEFEMDRGADGYRLPTEVEWEYAARGGAYNSHFSEDYAQSSGAKYLESYAWFSGNSVGGPKSSQWVRTKLKNQVGVHDMSGNVWEWVQDAYLLTTLPGADYWSSLIAPRDPMVEGVGSSIRVVRGGAWFNDASDLNLARRAPISSNTNTYSVGFRLVRPPPSAR